MKSFTKKLLITFTLGLTLLGGQSHAAIVTFDAVVVGSTSFGYDGDGDTINDVIFSTTDPGGFNSVGPGANMTFINEPGIEGTTLLNPDLRVDFLNGAVGTLSLGFALNSSISDPAFFASITVFDALDNLIGSASEVGNFTATGSGTSSFPEGSLSVGFSGLASYALFNFESQFGRYIIDNFEGTFGSTENVSVPEPATLILMLVGMAGLGFSRRNA